MKTNDNRDDKLARLLRLSRAAPRRLPDAVYNAQILAAIRTEAALRRSPVSSGLIPGALLRLRDALVLSAACAASACAVLFSVRLLHSAPAPEITAVRVADTRIAASTVGEEEGMPVLWLTGLRPLGEGGFDPKPKPRIN